MCGICGILDPGQRGSLASDLLRMSDSLAHRGPDTAGLWEDEKAGIALGHRRLSILDLSEAGAQPMVSACERWVIVFNGEIYNHRALRNDLVAAGSAPPWRGTSDTETLLATIACWGIKEALRRAYGMFALAIWDRKTEQLHLARDRMGEKPLYLANSQGGWVFGSELRALMSLPSYHPKLNRNSVTAYLAHGYVPEGLCIVEGAQKVPPGHVMTIKAGASTPHSFPYERFEDLAVNGIENRMVNEVGDTVGRLENTLLAVVNEQMLSDVPLGCFLSGGLDSSLVAALMQAQRETPVCTFSIGFDMSRFNEAPHAAAVARHLRTDHTEIILAEQDALAIVPHLATIYDEPFADSSQIPTVLLCREARKSVTVALSGDGGDEVFGGYNRYIMGPELLRRLQLLPRPIRRTASYVLSILGPMLIRENSLARQLSTRLRLPSTAIDKAVKLGPKLARMKRREDLYAHFATIIAEPSEITMLGGDKPEVPELPHALEQLDFAEWMMVMDSVTYLPGDILVKVDRAAMSFSLETRTPFLDARVIKAAWSLPQDQKVSNSLGKQVLRSVLDRHVPRALIDRPKQGFAVPVDRWLRGALRKWSEALLEDEELFSLAGLARGPVSRMWNEHQECDFDHGQKLWCVLMLLAWLREHAAQLQAHVFHASQKEAESRI